MHPQQNTQPELRNTAGLRNFLPHIGHSFYFLSSSAIGADISTIQSLPFFFLSFENAYEAILWATRAINRPGDFSKLMIGNGLGSSDQMYPSSVLVTKYSMLQYLLFLSIRQRNLRTVVAIFMRQQIMGNIFVNRFAIVPSRAPASAFSLSSLNLAYTFLAKQGTTTQTTISIAICALLLQLIRSSPQKFSAQVPFLLIKKQRSLMPARNVAISCEQYLREISFQVELSKDLTMYSIPVRMYSSTTSMDMNSQKWILGSSTMLSILRVVICGKLLLLFTSYASYFPYSLTRRTTLKKWQLI